jgi:enoyl-CoA hydratase
LANAVLEPDELLAVATKTAEEIASKGPLAVAAAKRLIRDGVDLPLPDANRLEQAAFGDAFGTEDQSEGMAAFLEKRAPAFRGT